MSFFYQTKYEPQWYTIIVDRRKQITSYDIQRKMSKLLCMQCGKSSEIEMKLTDGKGAR